MFGSHEFSSKRRLNTRGLQRWTILSRNVKKFCLREEYKGVSQTEEVWINETCLKAKIKASAWKTIRKTQYDNYEDYEEYKLIQYCLKAFLTLSCSYLRVNFSQSFIHLPCITFSSNRAEKRLHAFECRAK